MATQSQSQSAAAWARLKHGENEHRCYSRRPLCGMAWALDAPLARCTSAVLGAGGPIALLTGDGAAPGARMQVFSGAGEVLSAWEWDYGRVRALGWTPAVELVCVLESGRVMLWSLRGARTADFALGEACEHQGVLLCETFSDGFVVLTAAFRLFALVSYTRRIIVPLADPRLSSPPTAMAVLERGGGAAAAASAAAASAMAAAAATGAAPTGAHTAPVPRCPEVLLGTASRTILHIDRHQAHDTLLASGPFVRLAPSPDGKFVAAFSASGALLVLSADFSRALSELATHSTRPPRQLVWCGGDSIVLAWECVPSHAHTGTAHGRSIGRPHSPTHCRTYAVSPRTATAHCHTHTRRHTHTHPPTATRHAHIADSIALACECVPPHTTLAPPSPLPQPAPADGGAVRRLGQV